MSLKKPTSQMAFPKIDPSAVLEDQVPALSALDESFLIVNDDSFADLVHTSSGNDVPFQRWFRYREGFAPELIRRAIEGLDVDCVRIMDPFSGAGSTLQAARDSGIPSIGFDVNPIVTTIAQAKTDNYSRQDVERLEAGVEAVLGANSSGNRSARPQLSIIDKVFQPDTLEALLATRFVIDSISDPKTHVFLMAGWLAILEAASNVFKEGNGIKYRNRKRTKSGYVTVPWKSVAGYSPDGWASVPEKLGAQYRLMIDDIDIDSHLPVPSIRLQSSVQGIAEVDTESISLSIFSPPYCNNFNYMKMFKVELWMSGLIADYKALRGINQSALRSHVEMTIDVPDVSMLPPELLEVVDRIETAKLWSAKIPKTVLAYFVDMRDVLMQVHRTLVKGGECHVVIGNSAYGGIVVPTDVVLAKIATNIGFSVERIVVARHLTTSSQQQLSTQHLKKYLRESIVILKKV